MTMISAVSAEDRPYEKCMRAGAESLTDAELVAVIIRTGRRGASAVSLAENVLKLSGGFAGLTGLCHHSIPELMTIPGIGRVKAIQLQCVGELSRRIAKTRARELLAFPNADTIASSVASALAAEDTVDLVYCFEKNGVLSDKDDDNSVIPVITPRLYASLKASGVVAEGMIPKLDNSFKAISSGVQSVIIKHAANLGNDIQTVLKDE